MKSRRVGLCFTFWTSLWKYATFLIAWLHLCISACLQLMAEAAETFVVHAAGRVTVVWSCRSAVRLVLQLFMAQSHLNKSRTSTSLKLRGTGGCQVIELIFMAFGDWLQVAAWEDQLQTDSGWLRVCRECSLFTIGGSVQLLGSGSGSYMKARRWMPVSFCCHPAAAVSTLAY